LIEPVRGYLGPPGSLRRQQQRFKLLSEVAEVLLPSAVASSARLHAFLLFLLRLLPPLAASPHRLALRKNVKADASASAAASSSSSVPSASSLSSSESSVAADCSPSACFSSAKSSSSRNVLSSFRRPSAASLSSSSLAPKSVSSMPASDQALQECREPRQEGESDRLAGRHRRSCRNRVLSESFPSPLFDALVHAL
ncbi:hypothetical protein TGPRC2_248540, partial [Toxoplasma gondii TgCatPRC2]